MCPSDTRERHDSSSNEDGAHGVQGHPERTITPLLGEGPPKSPKITIEHLSRLRQGGEGLMPPAVREWGPSWYMIICRRTTNHDPPSPTTLSTCVSRELPGAIKPSCSSRYSLRQRFASRRFHRSTTLLLPTLEHVGTSHPPAITTSLAASRQQRNPTFGRWNWITDLEGTHGLALRLQPYRMLH